MKKLIEPTEGSWGVAFRDRGLGHGDYGVVSLSTNELICEITTGLGDDARIIGEAPEMFSILCNLYEMKENKKIVDMVLETWYKKMKEMKWVE